MNAINAKVIPVEINIDDPNDEKLPLALIKGQKL